MNIHTIRIISETREDAEQLRRALVVAFGAERLSLGPAHQGRTGAWLMYGTLALSAAEMAAASSAGAPTMKGAGS